MYGLNKNIPKIRVLNVITGKKSSVEHFSRQAIKTHFNDRLVECIKESEWK